LILVAVIDVPFQIWQHSKNLRMSRQQVKDELKQTEGDPQLKARVRQVQREMARSRMMAEVPSADVIITNPDHYAVALRYNAEKMVAPQLVAKGMDFTAAKIREIAALNNIPLVRSPLLDRTNYYSTEV
ncbi:MAG: EscU/YscU/HrcU family type III secretion system export apparatus switch protein, partial [Gammaproteobacteria bacterium]